MRIKMNKLNRDVMWNMALEPTSSTFFWVKCFSKCFHRVVRELMFVESNGDRPLAPNYLVLITDGISNNRSLTWHEAIAARAQEITILAVS